MNVETIYLYNYYDYDELPDPSIYATRGAGINISSAKLTTDVVKYCHQNGKKVGVWIDREYFTENEDFYHLILDMNVDFFCADFPLKAREARSKYLENKTKSSSPLT